MAGPQHQEPWRLSQSLWWGQHSSAVAIAAGGRGSPSQDTSAGSQRLRHLTLQPPPFTYSLRLTHIFCLFLLFMNLQSHGFSVPLLTPHSLSVSYIHTLKTALLSCHNHSYVCTDFLWGQPIVSLTQMVLGLLPWPGQWCKVRSSDERLASRAFLSAGVGWSL